LFGIDIDVRAVQIAALAVLLKARTIQPKAHVTDLNLACANVEQISGGQLDHIIAQAKFSHPIYERILRDLSGRMKESDQIGSLLRLEKFLEQLISEERQKAEVDKQFELSFPGFPADQFKSEEGIDEFFSILFEQVLQHLDEFTRASRTAGSDSGHFINEAAKGLRYVRLVSRHYDVVATNPPYMSRRNMSAVMAQHLDDHYPKAKSDLYAAFILRCAGLTQPYGKFAMITQQSFMFITSYEPLRADLRNSVAVETMAHLGPRAFPNVTGEKVNTTAFVFQKQPEDLLRQEQVGVYFRLVREPDADAKRRAFEAALDSLSEGPSNPPVFQYVQGDFEKIPGAPWAYWATARIRGIFDGNPMLSSVSKPWVGLQTSDNQRFLRFWWEIGRTRIAVGCGSSDEAKSTGLRWVPHMKGGRFQRWYGNQEFIVNWHGDGREMKAFAEELKKRATSTRGNDAMRDFRFYFQPGITWTHTSQLGLNARLMPAGFICNVEAMACYPQGQQNIEFVLAILNSKFATFVTNQLNPTIHYGSSEVGNLPLPLTPPAEAQHLRELCREALDLSLREARQDETTLDFKGLCNPPVGESPTALAEARQMRLDKIQHALNDEVFRLYGFDDDDRRAVEIENVEPVNVERVDNLGAESDTEVKSVTIEQKLAFRWISYAFGTVLGRFELGLVGGLGCGEFAPEVITEIRKLIASDGIIISDPNDPKDVVKHVLACLELMLGRDHAHSFIRTATEQDGDPEELLRNWCDRLFWKYHFRLYRNRPVYWPLQSPKRKLTVWLFHERLSKDTLFKILSDLVEPRIRWLEARIKERKAEALSSHNRKHRIAEKEASQLADQLDDLQEFAARLGQITQRGYTPHIDDGVLLNAAPLWELLPSWPETQNAWRKIQGGEYDWAQQAMEYRPDQVNQKCKIDKSLAIAHGLV
jgi:N-6 DNA Methylase